MAGPRSAEFDVGHPAPDRGRISPGVLSFAVLGAPVAWAVQLLFGSGMAGAACLGSGGTALSSPNPAWASPVMIAVNIVALLLAALAFAASFRLLRNTGQHHPGEQASMMNAGVGRSRYLAIWGVWTSVLFFVAIAFNTVSVIWGGLCGL